MKALKRTQALLPLLAVVAWCSVMAAPGAATPGASAVSSERGPGHNPALRFEASDTNGFTFDTGVLKGKLRAGGTSKGLTEVVHIPTGTRLDSSMGLLSHYRLLTANKRYGNGAWDLPSTATLMPDGSVLVAWPGASERPFDLHAHYRISAPDTIDVETSVLARTNLAGFESFLACYFQPGFSDCAVNTVGTQEHPGATQAFARATQDRGVWQAFPRDDRAAALIRDGRWTLPPSPVDWVLQPKFARPLAVRRAPRESVGAVLMSRPKDCFAVMTPFETEAHFSLYLCLLGTELQPGATASARARLVVRTGLNDSDAVQLYEQWQKQS